MSQTSTELPTTQDCRTPTARAGGDVARARSVDRNRGLHPELPPAAAFAADAAVARRSAHRAAASPWSWSRTMPRNARACRSRPNFSASGKLSGPLRGRAAPGQLPRDQCRVRDRAGRHSRPPTSFLMIDDDEIASPDWLERMVCDRRDHRRRSCRRTGVAGFRRRAEARPAPPSGIRAGLSDTAVRCR